MDKKSIVAGIFQLAVIVVVWMLNPNAMVEQVSTLLLVLGIGCTTGVIAPSMSVSTENEYVVALAVIFEIIYVAALIILWRVMQYNIVI